MKRILSICLTAMLMLTSISVVTMNAQTIVKGDMNDDGTVDVSDVTMTVSTILGNIPLQTISLAGNPFEVNNTLVVGTWYASDGTSFSLNEDGTTDFHGGTSYRFYPNQCRLLILNASGTAFRVIPVVEATSNYLLTVDYATGAPIYYTNESALPTGITLSQTSLAMNSGTTAQLTATVTPADAFAAGFTWSSSDESVATVDANGLVTAVGGGSCVITVTASGSLVNATCTVAVTQMVTSIVLSQTGTVLKLDDYLTLTAIVMPENAANRNVVWSSSNEDVAMVTKAGKVIPNDYGIAVITCSAADGSGVQATCKVTILNVDNLYVDLGLPSGTLWAACNIGAFSPEEYGDYFAWGETEPQKDNAYTWTSYKYAVDDYNNLTKYCNNSSYGNNGFTDNLTELELSDDAAYVNWGSNWRMPSKEQFDELINSSNTTTEWTTLNGVNGRKITSNTNGNSIFLPAAGYRYNSSLYEAGSRGYCWSRTFDSDDPVGAWYLYFNSSDVDTNYYSRFPGFSVRPVRFAE